jgi:hypothetical protein
VEGLALEAMGLLAETRAPLDRADAATFHGVVLRQAGRGVEAAKGFSAAKTLLEEEGAIAYIRHVDRLASKA